MDINLGIGEVTTGLNKSEAILGVDKVSHHKVSQHMAVVVAKKGMSPHHFCD